MEEKELKAFFAKLYGQMLDMENSQESSNYLWESYHRRIKAHDKVRCIFDMGKEIKENKENTSLLGALAFLFAFEGSYIPTIDSIIYLLVLDGHDLFDPIRQKYAHTPVSINKIDTSIKFRFLKEHNLDFFIRQEDSEIRNKLAHHDFDLHGKTELVIKGKEYNIYQRLRELLTFVNLITIPYVEALREESEVRGIFPKDEV